MAEPKLTCFLIDDDPDDQEIFAMTLREVNETFLCVTANNGIQALEKLSSTTSFVPDFIFLDLNMPLMGGKDCLLEIKKAEHLKEVPVIIYSTSSHQKDVDDVKKIGAAHFLTKPSNIDVLARILSRLFKQKALPFILNHENVEHL